MNEMNRAFQVHRSPFTVGARAMLILASRSPRRAALLREAGLRFARVVPPRDDPPAPGGSGWGAAGGLARAKRLSIGLAAAKARRILRPRDPRVPEGAVILAADTVLIRPGGGLIGRPRTAAEAGRILRGLSGRTHRAVTGIVLLRSSGETLARFADVARVRMGPLGPEEIAAYVRRGLWRGKAGGYDLRERRGRWPFDVRGDPATVVGLPMRRLKRLLSRTARGPVKK